MLCLRTDDDVLDQRPCRESRGDRGPVSSGTDIQCPATLTILCRLKADVLREAARFGGLVLVHDETRDGEIMPTWISADEVATARELFANIRDEGYNVTYFRTPVARDQSPNDGYLDTYTSLLASTPTSTSLVFNCGAGVVRSTFAMSVALIVRRKQLLDQGNPDPYRQLLDEEASVTHEAPNQGAAKVMKAQSEQSARDRSLLRLMHILHKCPSFLPSSHVHHSAQADLTLRGIPVGMPTNSQTTMLALLSSRSMLLENLRYSCKMARVSKNSLTLRRDRSALLGNYDTILSLLSCLDDGYKTKKVVDAVVDHCQFKFEAWHVHPGLRRLLDRRCDGQPARVDPRIPSPIRLARSGRRGDCITQATIRPCGPRTILFPGRLCRVRRRSPLFDDVSGIVLGLAPSSHRDRQDDLAHPQDEPVHGVCSGARPVGHRQGRGRSVDRHGHDQGAAWRRAAARGRRVGAADHPGVYPPDRSDPVNLD